jgi:hypothetical protein
MRINLYVFQEKVSPMPRQEHHYRKATMMAASKVWIFQIGCFAPPDQLFPIPKVAP